MITHGHRAAVIRDGASRAGIPEHFVRFKLIGALAAAFVVVLGIGASVSTHRCGAPVRCSSLALKRRASCHSIDDSRFSAVLACVGLSAVWGMWRRILEHDPREENRGCPSLGIRA